MASNYCKVPALHTELGFLFLGDINYKIGLIKGVMAHLGGNV